MRGASKRVACACLCCALATAGAETVRSPDGRIAVTVVLEDGHPRWSVTCGGEPLIRGGLLGIDSVPGPFALKETARSAGDSTWPQVWGGRSLVRDRYHELTFKLVQAGGERRELDVVLRACDEGVACRYVVPAQDGLAQAVIRKRLTEYRFGSNRPVYQNRNLEYGTAGIDQMSKSEGCVTVDAGGGCFVSLTDADRADFSQVSWERKKDTPGTIIGSLHSPARGPTPFRTSWEVMIVGEGVAKLCENRHIVENLCPPCAIDDTSWIRPGEAICQVRNTRMVTAELEKLMDFASAHNIEQIEIDHSWCGAETKWTPEEIGFFERHKSKFWDDKPEWRDNVGGNPMTAAKGWVPFRPKADSGGNFVDLDVPALTARGRRLKPPVGVCLYLRAAVLREFGGEHAIEDVFATYQRWGVAGIKAGFVPPASQRDERAIAEMVRQAAAHRLIVVIHDAYYPAGLSRTFPNLVNVEGVAGEEAEHSIPPAMKSRHDVMLPFTRGLMGPLDYTPEMFKPVKTHAHQVAMLLVYQGRPSIRGGLKQWSQGGEGGREIEFLEKLPGLFDETRVFTELGKRVTVARRSGETWFVASMGDAEPRRFKLRLDFLVPGRRYRASVHADTPGNRKTSHTLRDVTSETLLPVAMEPNGGHLMIIGPIQGAPADAQPSGRQARAN